MNTATQQPDPLELAGWLDFWSLPTAKKAAAALRRLHAENEQLRLDLEAVGADGVGPLMPGKPADCITRNFNTWSPNEGDTWYEHPADAQIIEDVFGGDIPVVGDEYEIAAGWNCVRARYRITSVTEDGDCEVECVSHPQGDAADQSGGIPPGCKLVPVKPNKEMLNAYDAALLAGKAIRGRGDIYCAMLAAAPQPPVVDHPEPAYLLRDLADDISVDALELIAAIRDAGLGDYSINMRLPARVCVAMCKRFADVGRRPVARVAGTGHLGGHFDWCVPGNQGVPRGTLLYTRPQPKREPLTHYEIHELFRRSWGDCQDGDEIKAFARAIERAHGIGGES